MLFDRDQKLLKVVALHNRQRPEIVEACLAETGNCCRLIGRAPEIAVWLITETGKWWCLLSRDQRIAVSAMQSQACLVETINYWKLLARV